MNHGSEPLPGWMPDEAAFFVRQHGFVLFIPHRRGQGRSADAGPYVGDVFEASGRDASALTDTLVAQTDDVMAAIAYAASLPYVDPKRVAVVGCSLGGIESLFAAERGRGIVAAVDFAGAAMTWATSVPLQDRMKLAARNAKVPVFFLQAENDFNTAPSRVLSDEMKKAGKPVRVHVFPPNGVTHEDGHAFCLGGSAPPWGDEVMDFLRGPMGLQ
jgi:dienelactone hydrolase